MDSSRDFDTAVDLGGEKKHEQARQFAILSFDIYSMKELLDSETTTREKGLLKRNEKKARIENMKLVIVTHRVSRTLICGRKFIKSS